MFFKCQLVQSCLIALLRSSKLLHMFCLLILSTIERERELLESLTVIADLPTSCNFISFTLCVLLCYKEYTHLGFLCLPQWNGPFVIMKYFSLSLIIFLFWSLLCCILIWLDMFIYTDIIQLQWPMVLSIVRCVQACSLGAIGYTI